MSKGKRRPGPLKDDPPHWDLYRPQDALYWKFGGPFIPVAEIEANPFDPDNIGGSMPKASRRLAWAREVLATSEGELAENIRLYADYHERGIDALPFEWLKESTRKVLDSPDRWSNVPTEVNLRQAMTYHQVRFLKGKIIACRAVIAVLERAANPLFNWRRDD